MKSVRFYSILFFGAVLVIACSSLSPSAYDIPERREFSVSQEISPCENFYEYACTNELSEFKLRPDRNRHILSLHDAAERLLEHKKRFLAQLPQKTDLSKRSSQLRDTYLACMNPNERAQEEKQFVREQIQLLQKKLTSREALLDYLGEKVLSPYFSFVSLGRPINLDNPDKYDLLVSVAGLMSLPQRSYYENKKVSEAFFELTKEFFETVGLDAPEKRARWVLDFETQIAQHYPLPEELRELSNKRSYIGRRKIIRRYPALRLKEPFASIPKSLKIRNYLKESYVYLDWALKELPLDQLKSVYLYHQLAGIMDDAYPAFFKKRFHFTHEHLGGPPKRPDRQERCTRLVMHRFSKELDAELIEKLYPDFPVQKFRKLVESVRTAMIRRLEENRWLSAKGKKGAIRKMKSVSMQLVRPETEREWDFRPLAQYQPNRPLANTRIFHQVGIDKFLKEIREPRNRDKWYMGPLNVNAYYSSADNRFVMLQGILQFPFYDPALPDPVNLGAVGMVVGHELGHAIDDQGSKYDGKGRLRQWMTQGDLKKFQSKGNRLIAQYEATGHNGKLTLGENIGDITGLSFAYEAAFPDNKGTLEQKRAFFLQYARVWCGTMLPAERKRRIKTDPHAQTEVRTNLPVKHLDGFYEAYQCKAPDNMYLAPEERVQIW